MKYRMISLMDDQQNYRGLWTIFTNLGPVVIIFTRTDTLAQAVEYSRHMGAGEGVQLGLLEITAGSSAEVVQKLTEMAPQWASETSFVTDEEELFGELFEALREQLREHDGETG
jgi:hypothetical protein